MSLKVLDFNEIQCDGNSGYLDYLYAADERGKVKEALINNDVRCNVCAKGAIFACTILRKDKLTVNEYYQMGWSGTYLTEALGGLFDAQQLNIIEQAYETRNSFPWGNLPPGAPRLRLIMENIIRNKGTFNFYEVTNA